MCRWKWRMAWVWLICCLHEAREGGSSEEGEGGRGGGEKPALRVSLVVAAVAVAAREGKQQQTFLSIEGMAVAEG